MTKIAAIWNQIGLFIKINLKINIKAKLFRLNRQFVEATRLEK